MIGARKGLLKYGFVAPALLVLIALNVFPLVYNVVLSFTDADLSGGPRQSVGGANYEYVFRSPRFAAAVRITALFVFSAVFIELVLGFLLALAIRRDFRGKTVILTILMIPMMLSPAVMGLYWNLILNGNYGVMNQMLAGLGLGGEGPQWLTDNDLKLITILIIDVWMWTPFMMLISLAALNAIPGYLYEAAEIDRASRWRVFRKITLPMCAPLLALAALLRTTDALKQFDLVMAITGSTDPNTQTLSALLYEEIFRAYKLGRGVAYACVILVMVIALASVFTRYLGYLHRRQGRQQT
jgi:multiple sugar transport system permease protein